jgi:hypothetical protein
MQNGSPSKSKVSKLVIDGLRNGFITKITPFIRNNQDMKNPPLKITSNYSEASPNLYNFNADYIQNGINPK